MRRSSLLSDSGRDLRARAASVGSVSRNYTALTIKTLFGEARACAYPGCDEPLIFRDRGRTTVVAEIAHIRSEQPDGPRHDPEYTGDINGPENLLLLCGKHHRPVDRHEVVYTVADLETWKTAQQASAGSGTPVTEADIRSYARLSDDERKIIMDIARRVERVTSACRVAQGAVEGVRVRQERSRQQLIRELGPMWENHDGVKVEVSQKLQLPAIDQRRWMIQENDAIKAELPRIREALANLGEELAVSRMISPSLAAHIDTIQDALTPLLHAVTTSSRVAEVADRLTALVGKLWRVAKGEEDGAE